MMTADYLNEVFSIDADIGLLIWKERPPSHFKTASAGRMWNTRFAGKAPANNVMRGGHVTSVSVCVNSKAIGIHRVIWILSVGPIPPGMFVDHINGDPCDNRLANLRLATAAENSRNRKRTVRNTTGFKGVTKSASGKWVAQLEVHRKSYSLGSFNCPTAAHLAYCRGAKKHFGEFARFK